MSQNRYFVEPAVAISLAMAIMFLPGCKRTEEEPTVVEAPDQGDASLVSLELPQANLDLGVTLNRAPKGLVVTFNEGLAMEMADAAQPKLRFTVNVDRPDLPLRSPATIGDFEVFIGKHTEGKINDRGTLETALGTASWALGSYFEEEQSFEDLRVFVPHPSGTGTLIISAVGPADVATKERRLDLVKALLQDIT